VEGEERRMTLGEIEVRTSGPTGTASVILLRGAVVRAGERMRWALGMTAAELKAELSARGCTATQRPAPATVVLDA
jgi:hypothetical protein